ncbi:hypothetical protein GCM10022234_35860 [Aeromicrobium panaciterrae]
MTIRRQRIATALAIVAAQVQRHPKPANDDAAMLVGELVARCGGSPTTAAIEIAQVAASTLVTVAGKAGVPRAALTEALRAQIATFESATPD